ncbi:MAG: hypothetical protein AAGU05_03190, partial [Anaerolineaceae bacterium]
PHTDLAEVLPANMDETIDEIQPAVVTEEPVIAEMSPALDPFFSRDGVMFYFRTNCAGYDNCLVTDTPIGSAVNDVIANGLPDDGVINIDGGDFGETLLFSNLPGALTLRGSANGGVTNLNGGLFIANSTNPLTFENFIFNAGVILQNAQQVSFINSIFNAGLMISKSNNLKLKNNRIEAGLVASEANGLEVDLSVLAAGMMITDSDGFIIHDSDLLSGLIISRSQNGKIIDSNLEGWLQARESDISFITSLDAASLAVELNREQTQVNVAGVNHLTVTGAADPAETQQMIISDNLVTLGSSQVAYETASLNTVAFEMSGQSDSIVVNQLGAAGAGVSIIAPVVHVDNVDDAGSLIISGGQVSLGQGVITSRGDIQVTSQTLTVASRLASG